MTPYFTDSTGKIVIYNCDCREILPSLKADVVVTDPPYGETSLAWDRRDEEWIGLVNAPQLWCFGSMRFWLECGRAFADRGWKFAQDIVWEKHNGSGFAADRFRRVHELALHWYRDEWSGLYVDVPVTNDATKRTVARNRQPRHTGAIGVSSYSSVDGGPRLMRSVQSVRSCHGEAQHPTQKPVRIIAPLVLNSCPATGVVLDPFCGSGSTLIAAREDGRRAIGIEIEERYCEIAAKRLQQEVLAFGDPQP